MADVKRLNYFNSQFLVDKDFQDEQSYQIDMRRRHNRVLHTWGIADGGFQVTGVGGKTASVSSGVAIDKDGNEIVLLGPGTVDLSDSSKFPANANVFITAKYQEVKDPADHYTTGGVDNFTRTTERPLLQGATAAPPSDGSVIPLAKVHLGADGNIASIDLSVQQASGSKIAPNADVQVDSLTVTGGLTVNGGVTIRGSQLLALKNSAGATKWNVNDTGPGGAGSGGLNFAEAGVADGRLYLEAGGNVGIGTTNPQTQLQVKSLTSINEGATAGGAWANFGSNAFFDGTWKRIDGTKAGANLHINAADATGQEFRFLRVEADGSNLRTFAGIGTGLSFVTSNLAVGMSTAGSRLDVAEAARSGTHASGAPLYVTGDMDPAGNGVEFRHSNGTQGIGFGYNTIYATGSNADQNLSLLPRGNGNVGIANGNPQTALQVKSLASINEGVTPGGAWVNLGSNVFFDGTWKRIDATKAGANLHMNGGDAAGQEFRFLRVEADGSNLRNIAAIGSGQTWFMGKVGINTTNPQGTLEVEGDIRAANSDLYFTEVNHNHTGFGNNLGFAAIENAANFGALMILGRTTTGGALNRTVKLWDFLQVNGNLEVTAGASKPGGGSWSALSDRSLKRNVQPVAGALDKMLQLRGVAFEWKEPEKQGNLTGVQLGMVAQDVEKVFPGWVDTNPDGLKILTFRGFEALTVEALRELRAEVDRLAQRVDALAGPASGAPARAGAGAGAPAARSAAGAPPAARTGAAREGAAAGGEPAEGAAPEGGSAEGAAGGEAGAGDEAAGTGAGAEPGAAGKGSRARRKR